MSEKTKILLAICMFEGLIRDLKRLSLNKEYDWVRNYCEHCVITLNGFLDNGIN